MKIVDWLVFHWLVLNKYRVILYLSIFIMGAFGAAMFIAATKAFQESPIPVVGILLLLVSVLFSGVVIGILIKVIWLSHKYESSNPFDEHQSMSESVNEHQ